ncbi:Subtilisin-like protease SBT1-6 [Nymphaea thermarum]|nr:Subtilisin-like protease SBT1-6 [Nymphaea thermarum]
MFIVGVQSDLKPFAFASHERWYQSSLRNVKPTEQVAAEDGEGTGILHVYDTVFQGFSARMTPEEAEEMGKNPAVLKDIPISGRGSVPGPARHPARYPARPGPAGRVPGPARQYYGPGPGFRPDGPTRARENRAGSARYPPLILYERKGLARRYEDRPFPAPLPGERKGLVRQYEDRPFPAPSPGAGRELGLMQEPKLSL